jgi:hypothetical protein
MPPSLGCSFLLEGEANTDNQADGALREGQPRVKPPARQTPGASDPRRIFARAGRCGLDTAVPCESPEHTAMTEDTEPEHPVPFRHRGHSLPLIGSPGPTP